MSSTLETLDFTKALESKEKPTVQAQAQIEYEMGCCAVETSIPAEQKKGVELLETAAAKGHSGAKYKLFQLYGTNMGDNIVTTHVEKAMSLLIESAHNHSDAAYKLNLCYL